jgi:hypothetical protein
MQAYRTFPSHDKPGGFRVTERDKPPHKIHHAPVIRADFDLFDEPPPNVQERLSAPPAKRVRAGSILAKNPEHKALPPAPIPAWARASGRAGEGQPTPADLVPSLPIGLSRLGLGLPRVARHPCGGDGALRRGLASFGVDVRLSDLYPDKYQGAHGYVASQPLDAAAQTIWNMR